MAERIILVSGRPEFLYDDRSCTVRETYTFGSWGSAALVSLHAEDADDHDAACEAATRRLLADDRVLSVGRNLEATLAIEQAHVSQNPEDVATIEDVRRLHAVPAKGAAGEGVTVVAMDSGVDTSHPVFDGVSIDQVDVTGQGTGDAVGHGTAVLGQVTRLAPDADLVSLRIFGDEGRTKTNVIMRAYEWLHANTDRYDVVNMSWGSSGRSEQIDRTHDELIAKGVRCVVAAGNTGEKGGSPATAERAFSTGACTAAGTMAEFSSYNPERDNPDVAAIGKDCRLAQATDTAMGQDLDGRWVKASGTSFSAPEVAGMVAKYRTVHPDASPKRIMEDFEAGARDIEDQPRDGAGLADYTASVNREDGTGQAPEPGPDSAPATVWAAPDRDLLEIDADWLAAGDYTATREKRADGTVIRLEPAERQQHTIEIGDGDENEDEE